MCVCYWPPVRVVCTNHEAAMFQPWTVTAPDLGSFYYCYVSYFWTWQPPSSCRIMSFQWGLPLLNHLLIHRHPPCIRTGSSAQTGIPCLHPRIPETLHLKRGPQLIWASPTSINFTCPYPTRSFQSSTPPPLPHPHHAWRIPVTAAPSLLLKYILTCPSPIFQLRPPDTRATGASPLPRIQFPLHIPRK